MANIINGKEISATIRAEIKEATEQLVAESGVRPGLAVIIVGEDPASKTYVKNKGIACEACGFYSQSPCPTLFTTPPSSMKTHPVIWHWAAHWADR